MDTVDNQKEVSVKGLSARGYVKCYIIAIGPRERELHGVGGKNCIIGIAVDNDTSWYINNLTKSVVNKINFCELTFKEHN